MVACRITDARNIAAVNSHNHLHGRGAGSFSVSQVPLKKYKQTRISSLTAVLIAILHWIWPPDRCTNCHSIYSSPLPGNIDGSHASVGRIQRSVDGRFVVTTDGCGRGGGEKSSCNNFAIRNGDNDHGSDEVDATVAGAQRRSISVSQSSSSDDGGFLSRRRFVNVRASWRRPLVASPSQLSLQSAAGSAKGWLQGLSGLLGFSRGGSSHEVDVNNSRYQNVYHNHYVQNIYRNLQPSQSTKSTNLPLHINTISGSGGDGGSVSGQQFTHHHHPHLLATPNLHTPSRTSRIFSSSPTCAPISDEIDAVATKDTQNIGLLTSPWALATQNSSHQHFSDLSTVYPSSAERSYPSLSSGGGGAGNLSRYRQYSHELPSLRTIQEETRRMNHGFVPLQIPSPPSWRGYPYHSQTPYHSYKPRTRWYPRHYSRLLGRSQSELLSPLPHLNLSLRSSSGMGGAVGAAMGLEASPESRSSSSGFGSKNTSNQPHGSHHSSSISEWRLLPPYRPPPPPPPPPPSSETHAANASALSANTYGSAYFGSSNNNQPMPQQAQAQAPVTPHRHLPSHHSTLPYYQQGSNYNFNSLPRTISPPYTMSHWLDMISRLNAATDSVNLQKSVDVGSVDGHYEFDPSTPTPSASTPTGGLRDDLNLHIDTNSHSMLGQFSGSIFHTNASAMPFGVSTTLNGFALRKPRMTRYENIEARLQAMKEEFYAYRKRQAMQRAGVGELESVC